MFVTFCVSARFCWFYLRSLVGYCLLTCGLGVLFMFCIACVMLFGLVVALLALFYIFACLVMIDFGVCGSFHFEYLFVVLLISCLFAFSLTCEFVFLLICLWWFVVVSLLFV